MSDMFALPGTTSLGRRLTRDAAEALARNWWRLLLNGAVLIVAGVLIFSIDWGVESLATFIGALFTFEGLFGMLASGVDARVRQARGLTGLLSIAAGIAIIVWPGPGIVAVAIFLGAWLIAVGTLSITGAFAGRGVFPDWWLLLVTGLLEVSLGVLALADPGATLAAIITVGGIWAIAVGTMRIVIAFQVKALPSRLAESVTGAHAGDHSSPMPAGTAS